MTLKWMRREETGSLPETRLPGHHLFVPTLVAFDCQTGIRRKTQVPVSTAHLTLYDSFLGLKTPFFLKER